MNVVFSRKDRNGAQMVRLEYNSNGYRRFTRPLIRVKGADMGKILPALLDEKSTAVAVERSSRGAQVNRGEK